MNISFLYKQDIMIKNEMEAAKARLAFIGFGRIDILSDIS